jgi:hypothetical protein
VLLNAKAAILRQHWLMPTLVAVVSALGLNQVQWAFRNANSETLPGGYLLQEWSSESMMQTLALKDMFAFGPMSLWYNHVYPPLQDFLRYAYSLPDLYHRMPPNYGSVDLHLYLTYAWCFGLVNAIVYLWVRDLTKSGYWALAVTVLWAMAPGYLTNMMLLDSTPLAMTFISMAFYFLYRFLRTRRLGYVSWFLAAVILASLSRNIMQAHVLLIIVVFVAVTWWLASVRAWWVLAINVALLGLLLVVPVKQQVLFGTLDTSTYSGFHRVGMIDINPHTVPEPDFPDDILGNAERFQSKWNTTDTLRDNYRLTQGSYEAWISDPITSGVSALRSLTITIPEALRPSSEYVDNLLVAEIPWKGVYDWVISGWRYLLILAGAFAVLWWSRGLRGLGHLTRRYGWFLGFYALIAAPVFWSNRFIPGEEQLGPIWTDATRLKMFLEVPLIVMVAYAVWLLPGLIRDWRGRKAPVTITDGALADS